MRSVMDFVVSIIALIIVAPFAASFAMSDYTKMDNKNKEQFNKIAHIRLRFYLQNIAFLLS